MTTTESLLIILAFFIAHWFLSLFSQTFYLHRYSAHKMFTMNKFWEKFFHLFTYLTQGSSYLNPRAYAILHRMHHAFSDTEKDPHSPHFFKDVFSMMMRTKDIYYGVLKNKVKTGKEFLGNYPIWNSLDQFGGTWVSHIAWGVFYTAFYFFFATEWWMYFLLPVHFLMGPVHGAIVNWAGHKYGYQNFDNGDKSKNTLVLDFLMMGELFQNNHHKFPNSPNFATRWFEFDPVYPIMKVLSWLRIIRLNRHGLVHG